MIEKETTAMIVGAGILYIKKDDTGEVIPIAEDQILEIHDADPHGERMRAIAVNVRNGEQDDWIWIPAGPGLTADFLAGNLNLSREDGSNGVAVLRRR